MTIDKTFRVKCTGGAAAQVLALMDAIYVSKKIDRPFVFDYYPFGTGTFWPFEILNTLAKTEIGNLKSLSRGHDSNFEFYKIGSIVENHPINSSLITLDKIYALLRKMRLGNLLLSLRREVAISFDDKQLRKISSKTKSISGGFVPLLDSDVLQELDRRFKRAFLPSPFGLNCESSLLYDVVIHYRIGDKRAKYTHPKVVGDDGILDPLVIKSLVKDLNLLDSKILVISDEPTVAHSLLAEVGIVTEFSSKVGDIWTDLQQMSAAKCFIGTWSQVSQLASVCVLQNGGDAYLPRSVNGKNSLRWELPGLKFYQPRFLEKGHPIYFN